MSSLERAIRAQRDDEFPAHEGQGWETDDSASESGASVASGKEETFEHRGEEVEEEMGDVAVAERLKSDLSVADRIQTIESALSSSATAAGSGEATSHHADEEGGSETRSPAEESSSFSTTYSTTSPRPNYRPGHQQVPRCCLRSSLTSPRFPS